jgi:hypothetical protein
VILVIGCPAVHSVSSEYPAEEVTRDVIGVDIRPYVARVRDALFNQITTHLPQYQLERRYHTNAVPFGEMTVRVRFETVSNQCNIFEPTRLHSVVIDDDEGFVARAVDRALNATLIEVCDRAIRSSLARVCPVQSITLSASEWQIRLSAFIHALELRSRFGGGPGLEEQVIAELLSVMKECSQMYSGMSLGDLRRVITGQAILMNALVQMSMLPGGSLRGDGSQLDTTI